MAFNYSTTWDDNLDFMSSLESTWFYNSDTTNIDDTSLLNSGTPSPTTGSKGSKGGGSSTSTSSGSSSTRLGPKGKGKGAKGKGAKAGAASSSGAKDVDYYNLELKQFLVVTSIVLIIAIIIGTIYSFIKQKSRDQIIIQYKSKTGRIFLISFLVALLCFFINSITMTYFVFNLDDLTAGQRPWLLCFGKIPYQIGRLLMEFFFILRLYFIFGKSAHSVPKWIIISLMIVSFAAFICGCIASMGSRSVYNWYDWDPNVDTGPRLVPIYIHILHSIYIF